MPIEPEGGQAARGAAPAAGAATPPRRWYHKPLALLFSVLCFELGVFLAVFPWLEFWDSNYFAALAPAIQTIWPSPYFKGAISGLGVVNIYISFVEIFRLRRFSPSPPE